MATITPSQRLATQRLLRTLCGKDRQARRLVLAHLPLVRDYRATEAFCAFVWPAEVKQVHSVIDHTYAAEPEASAQQVERTQRLQARYHHLDALLREERV